MYVCMFKKYFKKSGMQGRKTYDIIMNAKEELLSSLTGFHKKHYVYFFHSKAIFSNTILLFERKQKAIPLITNNFHLDSLHACIISASFYT